MSNREKQFILVLIALLFYTIAILGTLPAFSEFLVQRRCRILGAEDCGSDDVSSDANNWYLFCMLCTNIPNALMSSYWGVISEKYGRRPVLLLNYVCTCLWSASIFAVNAFDLPIAALVPVFFLTGFSGGLGIVLSCSFSIIADLFVPEERGSRFSVMSGVAFYGGGIIGPLLGGQLIKPLGTLWSASNEGHFHLVFILLLGCTFVSVLVTSVFLKESLSESSDASAENSTSTTTCCASFFADSMGALRTILRHRSLTVIVGCFSLLYINDAGVFGIVPVYAQRSEFALSAADIGWLVALQAVSQSLIIFCVLSPILALLERRNRRHADDQSLIPSTQGASTRRGAVLACARVGALMSSLGLLSYAVLPGIFPGGSTLFICTGIQGCGAMYDPSLRSLLSVTAEEVGEEQGTVLGALALAQSLVNVFAPLVFNGIYSKTASLMPSLCFYIGVIFGASALVLSFFVPPSTSGRSTQP